MEETSLSLLKRADGSASYSHNGYSVICAVNGPMEVQRREELPDEAAVDVVIRPAAGVGGVRERHLESVVQNALRQIVLVTAHPRTLIQITLQIVTALEDGHEPARMHQSASAIAVLPALLHASVLALLSTSIPLSMFMTSTSIAVGWNGDLALDPSSEQIESAASVHVLGFSSQGDLIVVESQGSFDIETWAQVFSLANTTCRGDITSGNVPELSKAAHHYSNLESKLRATILNKGQQEHTLKKSYG